MATKLWLGDDAGNEGDWSVAANWSGGVPGNGDDAVLQHSSQSVTAGLAQGAIDLATLRIDQSFTGQIGDENNYLVIGSSVVTIGEAKGESAAPPAGSSMIKLNLDTTATAVTVHNTGNSAESGRQALRLLMVNAANVVSVLKGSVSIAADAGETSQLATLNISYVDSVESDADVVVGSGVTLATVQKTGGSLALQCAVTTLTNRAGAVRTSGTGVITAVNMHAGSADLNSTGTITTLNGFGGAVDTTESLAGRTITTLNIYAGFSIKYDPAIVAITNKPSPAEPVNLIAEAA